MERDDLEVYRQMTPGERFALGLQLFEMAWHWLDVPDRATGDRKLAIWRREHDLSNEALLAVLRRSRSIESVRLEP